jgi:hypothetical protein
MIMLFIPDSKRTATFFLEPLNGIEKTISVGVARVVNLFSGLFLLKKENTKGILSKSFF